MANFIYPQNRTYVSTLQFANLSNNAINNFQCAKGERAGFRLEKFTDPQDGKELIISYVYDCSNGDVVYLTSLNVEVETDLTGGLFSSGCFPDGYIFSQYTKFRKANY